MAFIPRYMWLLTCLPNWLVDRIISRSERALVSALAADSSNSVHSAARL